MKYTKSVAEAASWIKSGKIICYPTEGVWGIGSLNREPLIKKIASIKKRSLEKKYILLFSSLKALADKYKIDPSYIKKAKAYESSFTTVIYPLEGGGTVAARIPDFSLLKELLNEVGEEIVSTSANITDTPTCKNAQEIEEKFNNEIYGILDLELQGLEQPSTIINIINDEAIR